MKTNRWITAAVAVIAVSLLSLTMVDVKSYFGASARAPAEARPLECIRSGGQLVGFAGRATEAMVRPFPSLKNVRSLVFTNVSLIDGDIRHVTGDYLEEMREGGSEPYGSSEYYGYGSYTYGSYGKVSDASDLGVGAARLKGGAHVEIKVNSGRLLKFRGAPLNSSKLFFAGRWELPYDDAAFTERAQAFVQIANQLAAECRRGN